MDFKRIDISTTVQGLETFDYIITAASAPSEREWSKLSNIITKNRNRLDCGFVSDLMIVKENNHLLQSYLHSLKNP